MPQRERITTTALAGKSKSGDPFAYRDRLPAAGAVLAGKYRIEGVLGRGGMGVVVLGRQLELDRPVAIKFLRAPLVDDARPLQRFGREARMIARMRSDHVVRVYDVGKDDEQPFIVMERLYGHDLAQEITRGVLPVERAVELALHACEALGEAHSLGIVHRDVKPSNLFVAEGFGGRESLKVLDFGVSKWLSPTPDLETPVVTTGGGPIGTPAFASPEQLARPETIDLRTDVWALGVVLYQAVSGELPFNAPTIPALYSQIIGSDPIPLSERGAVPKELAEVIMRCLRRSPDERYPSMLELARALLPFAPARAHGVVDSLAALGETSAAPPEEDDAEPVLSPLSSTLEISQITPEATVNATPAPPRLRGARALIAGAILFGAIGTAIALASRSNPPERGVASSTPSPPVAHTEESAVLRIVPEPERSAAGASVAAPAASESTPVAPAKSIRARPRTASSARPAVTASSGAPSAPATSAAPAAPTASAGPAQEPASKAPERSDAVPLYRH